MKHLNISSFLQLRPSLRNVGFVPTMGALHQGHINLVQECLNSSSTCVISIFVNPTQFAANEDLEKYPRTLESDITKLKELDHARIVLITPTAAEMYPSGIDNGVFLNISKGSLYEGKVRPHFFTGVCTVVCKLFNLVKPDIAFFGQKDIQQASIITQLAKDLLMDVKIKIAPTAREPSGLAMSSRNVYLSKEQRINAIGLYNLLQNIKNHLQVGVKESIDMGILKFRAKYPEFEIQYTNAVHGYSLAPFTAPIGKYKEVTQVFEIDDDVLCIIAAIRISDSLRLLDNIVLQVENK